MSINIEDLKESIDILQALLKSLQQTFKSDCSFIANDVKFVQNVLQDVIDEEEIKKYYDQ